MARLERPQTKGSNPATKFLEWKSEKKCFSYYDKNTEKNIDVELPFKVLFLEHYHVIKGWHGATDKGIISNEVFAIGSEPLTVRTFGGLQIAQGLYKDIKEKVILAGGKYFRSVYVMLEDGTIANLKLKGTAVCGVSKDQSLTKTDIDGYSEFYRKNSHLLDNQWIEVNSVADAKKGATEYSVPVFSIGKTIDTATNEAANQAAATLQSYINEYRGQKPEEITVNEPVEVDPLDF